MFFVLSVPLLSRFSGSAHAADPSEKGSAEASRTALSEACFFVARVENSALEVANRISETQRNASKVIKRNWSKSRL